MRKEPTDNYVDFALLGNNIYDITSKIVMGKNSFGAILGRGRYSFNTEGTPWDGTAADWIDQPKMLAVIEFVYEDGAREYVVSDETWEVKNSGILQDCMYMGETLDARFHDFEWLNSENKDGWVNCAVVDSPRGKLRYDFSEPIRITERVTPCAMNKIGEKQLALGWLDLETGEAYYVNKDVNFYGASLYKVALNMYWAEKVANGEATWDTTVGGGRLETLMTGSLEQSNNNYSYKLYQPLGAYRASKLVEAPYYGMTAEEAYQAARDALGASERRPRLAAPHRAGDLDGTEEAEEAFELRVDDPADVAFGFELAVGHAVLLHSQFRGYYKSKSEEK